MTDMFGKEIKEGDIVLVGHSAYYVPFDFYQIKKIVNDKYIRAIKLDKKPFSYDQGHVRISYLRSLSDSINITTIYQQFLPPSLKKPVEEDIKLKYIQVPKGNVTTYYKVKKSDLEETVISYLENNEIAKEINENELEEILDQYSEFMGEVEKQILSTDCPRTFDEYWERSRVFNSWLEELFRKHVTVLKNKEEDE